MDNHRVQVFDRTTGAFVHTIGLRGDGHGQLDNPRCGRVMGVCLCAHVVPTYLTVSMVLHHCFCNFMWSLTLLKSTYSICLPCTAVCAWAATISTWPNWGITASQSLAASNLRFADRLVGRVTRPGAFRYLLTFLQLLHFYHAVSQSPIRPCFACHVNAISSTFRLRSASQSTRCRAKFA